MCKVLGIARASYYKWATRKETTVEIENKQLAQLIVEYDEQFNHILGYRRMTRWINKFNHRQFNHKRVKRMMNLLGIKSVIRKKKSKYLKTAPEIIAENVLGRDFNANHPNEKWATDVTEFKIVGMKEKVYLSAIIDLYDRSIVAYKIGQRNDNNLVFRTFEKAMEANPKATPLFHSDRGFQYTSKVFKSRLEECGMAQSMSRVARCIDNGPIEGFWGIIKSEMYYLHKFQTAEGLKEAIDSYIDFYNHKRLQGRFHDQTPMEVRLAAIQAQGAVNQYPIAKNIKIEQYYASLQSKQLIDQDIYIAGQRSIEKKTYSRTSP